MPWPSRVITRGNVFLFFFNAFPFSSFLNYNANKKYSVHSFIACLTVRHAHTFAGGRSLLHHFLEVQMPFCQLLCFSCRLRCGNLQINSSVPKRNRSKNSKKKCSTKSKYMPHTCDGNNAACTLYASVLARHLEQEELL